MVKMGKVRSCEPWEGIQCYPKGRRISHRGLIREARGMILPPFSRRMCSEATSGCRWRGGRYSHPSKERQEGDKASIHIFKKQNQVLRESGCPLLICPFVTPKVHHGVSHPSSGQSRGLCFHILTSVHEEGAFFWTLSKEGGPWEEGALLLLLLLSRFSRV